VREELTLNVAQGIGDIFWVYQKFSPHVRRINFNILCVDDGEDMGPASQTRAVDFVKLFPKVREVRMLAVPRSRYFAMADSSLSMKDVLAREEPVDYACNHALEHGVRIEEIDPEYEIEGRVSLPELELPLPRRGYLALYVSGLAASPVALGRGIWNVARWAKLIELFYRKKVVSVPVVMLGAYYDRPALEEIRDRVVKAGVEVAALHVDLPPRFVVNLLRRCTLFVGHQSGLNVLADNLGALQLMLYMNAIHRMSYSWCRKAHVESRRFTAAFFDQTAETVLGTFTRRLSGHRE
jgi:hypothetical protein